MIPVKELKEILEEFPDDSIVVVASDPEGNDYRVLGDVFINVKVDLASGSNQYVELVYPEDEETDEYTEEELKYIKPACVMWPGYIPQDEDEEDSDRWC